MLVSVIKGRVITRFMPIKPICFKHPQNALLETQFVIHGILSVTSFHNKSPYHLFMYSYLDTITSVVLFLSAYASKYIYNNQQNKACLFN